MLLAARRAALGLTTTAALVGGCLVATPASAAETSARPTARAGAAADWLAGQLDRGLAVSEFQDA
jgi:hypothetical protein